MVDSPSRGFGAIGEGALQQRSRHAGVAKRRKVALACSYCRARKTRCDGRRPACSTCAAKGSAVDCVYEQGALKTQIYVSSLEERLREYERRSNTDIASDGSPRARRDEHARESTNEPASNTCPRSEVSGVQTRAGNQLVDRLPTPPHHDLIDTDAMVIVPSPEDAADCPVGESAPIAFVQSMLRTIGKNNSGLRVSRMRFGNAPASNKGYVARGSTNIGADSMLLPPRRVADGFVESFWRFLHPILPILHKPTFMKSYQLRWATGDELGENHSLNPEDPVFFSTINIIFAIGCQFSDQVATSRKFTMADDLYQRSKALFTDEFLDCPTLSIVQLLLLTGVYLQSTRYANRCWNVVSKLLMIDDEFLLEDGEGAQPSHLNPRMGSFVYSLKLFDILNEILATFYARKNTFFQGHDTASWDCQELDVVLRFNMQLNKFWESVPNYLAVSQGPEGSNTTDSARIAPGAKILYPRFLYIRIFLLRPILLLVAQASNNAQPGNNIRNQDRLEQQVALKAYTFSCAIVLVAARLCPPPELDFGSTSLQASWSQCIELFDHYKQHFPFASHVIRILEMLEERLQHHETTRQSQFSQPEGRGSESREVPATEIQPLDPAASFMELEGVDFESNWAMLDDLLQLESLRHNVADEECFDLGTGWADSF
ncbi:C6 transcription factor [Fusarium albosuccineum]|uniref:C6 transcription factor n=1 Tax=Fusarium albosuccineum TaxID=1237068 RepID=A0A8H4LMS8_9HYPO|nr:C6 transcription factor [Fusarium albosuccineum]